MALEEFSIPTHVMKHLRDLGYSVGNEMDAYVSQWWQWYTSSDGWYKVEYRTQADKIKTRERFSLHPAKRAAREWASLLLNEDTKICAEGPKANEWLNGIDTETGHVKGYFERNAFWSISQGMLEKAFALGTGAWALWFDVREDERQTVIKPRTYDARMVVPLSWDDDGVTECAFVTRTMVKGKAADQLQMHVLDGGGYKIKTAIFQDGKQVVADGVLPEFDTGCDTPTFGIVRPGIENTLVDLSPKGVSVFADAVDSIKAVDLSFDALYQEIELTEPMVFMDETMIDVRDQNGKMIPVPRGDNNRLFRKLFGQAGKDLFEVYSPAIRAEPICRALNVALAEFGDQCGFGPNYFTFDEATGLKTAHEVASDNSMLMRSITKHEVILTGALRQVVAALLTCARLHCGADIEDDFGGITVNYDDSIITDTQTDKAMMLNEVAAGVVPRWMYLTTFYGMTEDEAKAAVGGGEVSDMGF